MRVVHHVMLLSVATIAAQAADYCLPFEGRWFVMQAGDTLNVNHHMSHPSQWYGIDFMKAGGQAGRALSKGAGKSLDDFFSWGEPVLSPVVGTVEQAHDGEMDNPLGKKDADKPFGNYVSIRVGPSEYVFLAHFQKGTVAVKAGDRVTPGQVLGRCGNSGHSDYPHIHLHTQNESTPFDGQGMNNVFRSIGVELSGKRFSRVDWPLIRGLFVWNE